MKKLMIILLCVTALSAGCESKKQKELEAQRAENKQKFQEMQDEQAREELYQMVEKILSHKTNRIYSDGFYSTPIFRDDNGREYIIVRTESAAKIIYLDNRQERILSQGVAILLSNHVNY